MAIRLISGLRMEGIEIWMSGRNQRMSGWLDRVISAEFSARTMFAASEAPKLLSDASRSSTKPAAPEGAIGNIFKNKNTAIKQWLGVAQQV